MMVRGMYAQLMATGVHHNFVEWNDTLQREEQFSKVFNVKNSTMAFEDTVQYFGTGPAPEKPEGTPVQFTDLLQGPSYRVIHLTYSLGAQASFELVDDDQYKIIEQAPKALARGMAFTKEMVPWNVFNNGFTTMTTPDGVSLFNSAHPLAGGPAATNIAPGVSSYISSAGTYPNRPPVDVDLTVAGIQLMTNQMQRLPDSLGLPIQCQIKQLVLPPELRFIAREYLGSPGQPNSANNNINSLLGEDLTFILSNYLTSTSAWFGLADKSVHQLVFYWRMKPDTDYDDHFQTRSVQMITVQRFSAAPEHWLGTWGSNGP